MEPTNTVQWEYILLIKETTGARSGGIQTHTRQALAEYELGVLTTAPRRPYIAYVYNGL